MSSNFKEERIRGITSLYYSRPEILQAIFDFSKNREISPRYFEGFGKRPDSFQYKNDIFEMVKRGATSFHCSEEIWEDPMKIQSGMTDKQLNEIRIGWDLLIDIDCKYFDFSKKAAEAIINVFNQHGIKNIGIKFSGSKGFHIILPWKAFPQEMGADKTKDLFPELPRKLISYIRYKAEQEMQNLIPEDMEKQFKNVEIKRGKKCNNCREVAEECIYINYFCPKCHRQELRRVQAGDKKQYKCPDCRIPFEEKSSNKVYECTKCNLRSDKNPENFSRHIEVDLFELMGLDLILVSPRHLFRMPYSLHEKTSLASVVIDSDKINEFDLLDANPMKVQVKNFMPDSEQGEAEKLVREALDWAKTNEIKAGASQETKLSGKYADFKPIKLDIIKDSDFPPCITNILKGIRDGKKRAVFALINFFRSIGMNKEEMEKRMYEWNEKNNPPLKQGYLKSQLSWAYKRKPLMPPNCKEFYQGIGVCAPDNFCTKTKNPVNYIIRKSFVSKKPKKSNKFKKKN